MWLGVVLHQPVSAAGLDQAVVAIEIEALTRRRPVAEPVFRSIAVGWPEVAVERNLADPGKRHPEGSRIAFKGRARVPERVERGRRGADMVLRLPPAPAGRCEFSVRCTG